MRRIRPLSYLLVRTVHLSDSQRCVTLHSLDALHDLWMTNIQRDGHVCVLPPTRPAQTLFEMSRSQILFERMSDKRLEGAQSHLPKGSSDHPGTSARLCGRTPRLCWKCADINWPDYEPVYEQGRHVVARWSMVTILQ